MADNQINQIEGMFASKGVTKSDRALHTPGAFAKKYLLYVQEAGTLESIAPHICRRKNLDSYLIFAVLDGKGSITYEGARYGLRKGECVWIDCSREFEHISSEEEPWKLAWVHFNGNCAKEFYGLFRERNHVPVFLPADLALVGQILMQALGAVKENASGLEVHSLLTQLVAACVQPPGGRDRMKEVREYINANFKESGLADLLPERFQISGEELEQMFGESFGIGLLDYIWNRRLNAAKEQLRFTIWPMEKVVRESGIGDADLFYRLFQEHENMGPEEYRRNWAQWMKD